ncbi:hypothetical protein AMTRI_Chr07g30160 [Amborella trichopoda]
MPLGKVSPSNISDAMKLESKVLKSEKEGQDSLDSFIRQAIGREPFLSFSRAGESPVQWIQLLHALDQQGPNKISKGSKDELEVDSKEYMRENCNGITSYSSELNGIKDPVHYVKGSGSLGKGRKSQPEQVHPLKIPEAVVAFAQAAKADLPGWPLLSPSKPQMHKCDKCSREFYSPINHRRHVRVHRRSLNIEKESGVNRDYLGTFWDKLSLDEAKEIVSFKNVVLEDVPGSSIVRALTSFIRKPSLSSLPHSYVKAGSALLDLVQAKLSRFPISSKDLFSLLDDASERTFLCAGTAISMQKFIFDGEAGKIGLELRNLVACTSFLVEQKLIKAWLTDKDAEALRCQKLLVEEEEAAQRRQAEILEKKRLKKLRQRELKAKDQADTDKVAEGFSEEGSTDPLDMTSSSSPGSTTNPGLPSLSDLTNESGTDADAEGGAHTQADMDNGAYKVVNGLERHQVAPPRHPISRAGPRFRGYSRAPPPSSGHLVWAPKVKPDHEGLCTDERGVCRSSEGFFVDDRAVHRSKEGTCMDRKVACRSYEGSCRDKGAVHGEEGSCMEERVMHGSDEGSSMDGRAVHEKEGSSMDERIGHGNNMVSFMNERVLHGDDNRSCMHEKAVCRGAEGLQKVESMVHRDNDERCEVLIGSISVVLGGARVTAKKSGLGQNGISRSVVKLWRPVGLGPKNGGRSEVGPGKGAEEERYGNKEEGGGGMSEVEGGKVFSSQLLEAFLSEKPLNCLCLASTVSIPTGWQEAMAGDHVILDLSSDSAASDCTEGLDRENGAAPCLDHAGRSVFGNAENRLVLERENAVSKGRFRHKSSSLSCLKYIPKQNNC